MDRKSKKLLHIDLLLDLPISSQFISRNKKLQNSPQTIEDFTQYIQENPQLVDESPFLPDLIHIEQAYVKLSQNSKPVTAPQLSIIVNPHLELIPVQYIGLPNLLTDATSKPSSGSTYVLIFRKPGENKPIVREASSQDLLALKIITEELDYRQLAHEIGTTLGSIDNIIFQGVQEGILLSPPSNIRRCDHFSREIIKDEQFFVSPVFTLQWHITQQCDLHCKHCYDRSERKTVTLKQGIRVLDDLYDFCQKNYVYGQVTFTGGNPLLHPEFIELYREAADRGFLIGILGNPTTKDKISELITVCKPRFYQVSLEGLETHNDAIRGKGHYKRVLRFLEILKETNIFSMVMLTLTKQNTNQVLELAEVLRDKVDRFNFNRLSMVGEGAALTSTEIDDYPDFLKKYLTASKNNPIMGLKDNLFNILQMQQNKQMFFGGCAGYGCGAAFNFVSLLPDGRVDACRKFDSPIGDIFKNTFNEIYYGESAERYRNGPSACRECDIRPVCGSCMAVMYGMGKDILLDKDPYCFISG